MALHWMKTYLTETQISGYFHLTEKTARSKIWTYLHGIQALKGQKIIWPNFEDFEEVFVGSVDGAHCRVNEPRQDPDRR